MREIVLDTETTGLKPGDDRIVEIGCVELVNHMATGETYWTYVNPQRDMPAEAEAVHGLSQEFLADKPLFADIADDFMGFLADSPLVIHNASFDMGFINAELERMSRPTLDKARAIDTVSMARRRFPGAQANLDALCRRFQIDISDRQIHGALKDARLLAEVYLELIGGRQPGLELAPEKIAALAGQSAATQSTDQAARPPRPHAPTAEEAAAHEKFIAGLKDPIWKSGD